jgi:FtsH-binding integral membrane protein
MNRYLTMLILVWWAGAGIATLAIFVPVYESYLVVSIVGWLVIAAVTGLTLVEIRRIKAEDKKKEELKG